MQAWLLRHRFRVLVHRIRFPGQPMFNDAAAREVLGTTVIVGITYEDESGRLIRQEQFYGTIVRVNREEGIVIELASGVERTLPPDLRALFGARRGEYRFRSTGEVITNPDLRTTWTAGLPDEGRTADRPH